MKQYIGETVKLHIDRAGTDLFYTAEVLDVDDTHISFLDRYRRKYCYRRSDVVSINDS